MSPQMIADQLRACIKAPPGAVTVWPWHDDSGHITMLVVIDADIYVDTRSIPQIFQGFTVKIERREKPIANRL